jgi:hypothetical protein
VGATLAPLIQVLEMMYINKSLKRMEVLLMYHNLFVEC